MTRMTYLIVLAVLIGIQLAFTTTTAAQEEVASSIRRYKEYEVSTGYYEEYEAKPRRQIPLVEVPGVRRGLFPYSPAAADVRVRTRLAEGAKDSGDRDLEPAS